MTYERRWTTAAVVILAVAGLTASCVPPPAPGSGAPAPPADTTAPWTTPAMPPYCTSAQLASGDTIGCLLPYARPADQGWGTPPFPMVTPPSTPGSPKIPWAALDAYREAVTLQKARDASCAITPQLIAAIGYSESRHAYDGARIGANGKLSPPIIGGPTGIPNTLSSADKARFANSGPTLQAVGATQFLPTTWKLYEPDGNGDGVSDPQNIFDDALGTAMFLCKVTKLRNESEIRASINLYGYRTAEMQDDLLARVEEYRAWLATDPTPASFEAAAAIPAGWSWLGWAYNGSPVLAGWEKMLARSASAIGPVRAGNLVAPPEVVRLYEGFVQDLVNGGYRIKESGSYSFRCTSNSGRKDCVGLTPSSLSMHAWGLALDINWSTNPERIYRSSGATSACQQPMVTDLPHWAISAAQRWGLFWAGYGWSNRCPTAGTSSSYVNRDPMHFEFRGTAAQAQAILAWNQSHPVPPEAQPPAR